MRRPSLMQSVLSPDLQDQLAKGRQLLAELRHALARYGVNPADEAALAASIRQLDEFFLLVVVGEFNAGKSAFINALVGQPVLQEGVTPTTAAIHVLKHGDTVAHGIDEDGLQVITAPADLLRDVHIVDTPGTNAVMREHERLTADFVPRADLVLFVTSADRPFTETERAFLETIRGWGKKIVVVINKVDIFERAGDVEEVARIRARCGAAAPGADAGDSSGERAPGASRKAARPRHGRRAASRRSRRISARFSTKPAVSGSKLANPLGVGEALAHRYATIAEERLTLLNDDVTVLDRDRAAARGLRADLSRGFELRMTAVEKELIEMERRGHEYFEDTLRLGRVVDLLNRARVQKEFEERVVADAPRQIERRVAELIDWLIDQDFRQWQAVTSTVASRVRSHGSAALGAPEVGTFHTDRARLIDAVGTRSAAGGRDLRQAPRGRGDCGTGARRGDHRGRGRRRGGRAGHAGHARRVDCRCRRDRHSPGERRCGARIPGHPGAAAQGQDRDEAEDHGAASSTGRRTPHRIRAGARAEPRAHRTGHRPVQPVRPGRARAVDRGAYKPRVAAQPRGDVPRPPRCVKKPSRRVQLTHARAGDSVVRLSPTRERCV